MSEIVKKKLVTDPLDIMMFDFIDFDRAQRCWDNSADAIKTIFSWFEGTTYITEMYVPHFHFAPKRDDWPGWKHRGNHPQLGEKYYYYFKWCFPDGEITFDDSPDFTGIMPYNDKVYRIRGDIGKVAPATFAREQKQMQANDLWISVLHDGTTHILIEPIVSIVDLVDRHLHDQFEHRL